MPDVLTRYPLQPLSMSATQRSKRKTASRVNFDEEDRGPPTKKKTRVESDAPQTNGKAHGQSNKRSKAVYEEERDGFTFSRAAKGRKTLSRAVPEPIISITEEDAESMPSRTTKRSKPAPNLPAEDDTEPRRRRSARLSGDKEPTKPAEPIARRPKKSTKGAQAHSQSPHDDREYSPQIGAGLKVGKSRDGIKIALPFADTPVIKRNKEMRAHNKGKPGLRRSSAGSGGRRGSSLFESGTSNGRNSASQPYQNDSDHVADSMIAKPLEKSVQTSGDGGAGQSNNLHIASYTSAEQRFLEINANISTASVAVPHADVDVLDFYKLIDPQNLTEPKRMHQLLIWCASRALLDKRQAVDGTNTIETIAIESARQIQDELINEFRSRSDLSNWFDKEDLPVPSIPKKPNPRNIKNEEKLKELEEEIHRLEAEEKSWKSLLSPVSSKSDIKPANSNIIQPSLLSDSQKRLLSLLDHSMPAATQPSADIFSLNSLSERIQNLTKTLEPTIDALADGVHRLSQYSSAASQVADRVTGVWARKLHARDESARREGGSADIGARDVLRALAGSLNEA